MSTRRQFTAEEKVKILREHLENNVSIPDVCEKHRVHPNQFYRWKREFFENAVQVFQKPNKNKKEKKRLEKLQERLKDRNEVIAELLQENLSLKKYNGDL